MCSAQLIVGVPSAGVPGPKKVREAAGRPVVHLGILPIGLVRGDIRIQGSSGCIATASFHPRPAVMVHGGAGGERDDGGSGEVGPGNDRPPVLWLRWIYFWGDASLSHMDLKAFTRIQQTPRWTLPKKDRASRYKILATNMNIPWV